MFNFSKKKFDKTSGGVLAPHYKNTTELSTEKLPVPKTVTILMSQHIGAPCTPTVKPGQEVFVGTLIGDSDSFVSAPIHSSVSGKVKAINDVIMTGGGSCKAVVIESDGEQTPDPELKAPKVETLEDFIAEAKKSGIVGLGGAGFPTFIKLNPKNLSEVDTLIINAAECEPFITSDYREMMENPDGVLSGVKTIQQFLGLEQVYIGIENNKPKAIELLREKVKDDNSVEIVSLKSRYPQGGEKVLIHEITGKVVKEGKLPADEGVLVFNVTTVAKLDEYLKTGMPLVEKTVTVDGDAVTRPANVVVPIGTDIGEVLEYCGGAKGELKKILMGGPMMGIALHSTEYPVVKNNNAILFLGEQFVKPEKELACIRCGRCVYACPFNLMPPHVADAMVIRDINDVEALKVNICMECGCCSYVCPSKRPLVQTMRLGKQAVAEKQREEREGK